MEKEIINRVAKSKLITIDLSDYAPKDKIIEFDLKPLLFNDIILKEKEFRLKLKKIDFSVFKNKTVALFCSSNAIVPMWSYMLVSSYLHSFCCKIYSGNKTSVIQNIILKNISLLQNEEYKNKNVIVKGCSDIPLNESLYIAITIKLKDSVNSLMFGEACSAVPVYKKKKNA
tara:strand:+ start:2433 stop:2948 length:516 start_codon:yes stop_codon:yes gene_type:complete